MNCKLHFKLNFEFFNVFSYILRLHQSKKDTCRQEQFITKKLMESMLTRETIILDEDDENAYEIDEYPELTDTQLKTITSALYGGAKSDVSNYIIFVFPRSIDSI